MKSPFLKAKAYCLLHFSSTKQTNMQDSKYKLSTKQALCDFKRLNGKQNPLEGVSNPE